MIGLIVQVRRTVLEAFGRRISGRILVNVVIGASVGWRQGRIIGTKQLLLALGDQQSLIIELEVDRMFAPHRPTVAADVLVVHEEAVERIMVDAEALADELLLLQIRCH